MESKTVSKTTSEQTLGDHDRFSNAECRGDFYLTYWGEIQSGKWVEHDLGINETDLWFCSAEGRAEAKAEIRKVADRHGVVVAFREADGPHTHTRTVARMTFVLPDGAKYPYIHDFGYAVDPSVAEFMFTEGNYACDCNRTLLLSWERPGVVQLDCGDKVELRDFVVSREADQASSSRSRR